MDKNISVIPKTSEIPRMSGIPSLLGILKTSGIPSLSGIPRISGIQRILGIPSLFRDTKNIRYTLLFSDFKDIMNTNKIMDVFEIFIFHIK